MAAATQSLLWGATSVLANADVSILRDFLSGGRQLTDALCAVLEPRPSVRFDLASAAVGPVSEDAVWESIAYALTVVVGSVLVVAPRSGQVASAALSDAMLDELEKLFRANCTRSFADFGLSVPDSGETPEEASARFRAGFACMGADDPNPFLTPLQSVPIVLQPFVRKELATLFCLMPLSGVALASSVAAALVPRSGNIIRSERRRSFTGFANPLWDSAEVLLNEHLTILTAQSGSDGGVHNALRLAHNMHALALQSVVTVVALADAIGDLPEAACNAIGDVGNPTLPEVGWGPYPASSALVATCRTQRSAAGKSWTYTQPANFGGAGPSEKRQRSKSASGGSAPSTPGKRPKSAREKVQDAIDHVFEHHFAVAPGQLIPLLSNPQPAVSKAVAREQCRTARCFVCLQEGHKPQECKRVVSVAAKAGRQDFLNAFSAAMKLSADK